MNQENPQDYGDGEVLIEMRGSLACVTLNRPRALNALSLEMIRTLASTLKRWENDKKVAAVFIKGAGDRAFSSGGDVKTFYSSGMSFRRGEVGHKVPVQYFAEEYSLDKQVFHYPKPIIAFMNGITMGGGYGIAAGCRYRVATDRTVFAMPEVKTGFFPDVGSIYHLRKCPSHVGWYLALTGNSIGPADMLNARLAEYHVPVALEAELIGDIERGGDIGEILKKMHVKPLQSAELPVKTIDKLFSHENLSAVLSSLAKDGSDWARQTFEHLNQRSRTSVLVASEQLRRSEGQSFDEVIATDFVLVQRFLQGFDMFEGIRAAIIEKDHAPRWEPAYLSEMEIHKIKEYFNPTGYDLKDVQIFES